MNQILATRGPIAFLSKLYQFFWGPLSVKIAVSVSLMQTARIKGYHRLSRIIENHLQRRHGLFISHLAEIHPSVKFPHPTGIVIGGGVRVGKNCLIYQNVTVGALRVGEATQNKYPTLAEGCIVYAGAAIVGPINLGSRVIVAANSVVTQSVPPSTLVAGAPAKVVRTSN